MRVTWCVDPALAVKQVQLHVTNTAVNATGTVTTLFSGGVYVMAELCYLIPEEVAGINEVPLPGSNYSGFIG